MVRPVMFSASVVMVGLWPWFQPNHCSKHQFQSHCLLLSKHHRSKCIAGNLICFFHSKKSTIMTQVTVQKIAVDLTSSSEVPHNGQPTCNVEDVTGCFEVPVAIPNLWELFRQKLLLFLFVIRTSVVDPILRFEHGPCLLNLKRIHT